MSQAELLILGGAALLIVVDLVFGIIVRGYAISDVIWAAAAAALLLAFAQRRAPGLVPVAYETALIVLGILAAVVGVREVVGDVSFVLRPPTGADLAFVLGLIGLVVGAGAMGLGAWRLLRSVR